MTPVTLSQPVTFRPAPEDPFEEIMLPPEEQQELVPPDGASEGDDPHRIDRYEAEQFLLSIAQFYDTAWPLVPEAA